VCQPNEWNSKIATGLLAPGAASGEMKCRNVLGGSRHPNYRRCRRHQSCPCVHCLLRGRRSIGRTRNADQAGAAMLFFTVVSLPLVVCGVCLALYWLPSRTTGAPRPAAAACLLQLAAHLRSPPGPASSGSQAGWCAWMWGWPGLLPWGCWCWFPQTWRRPSRAARRARWQPGGARPTGAPCLALPGAALRA
jgi:hypothetical protein